MNILILATFVAMVGPSGVEPPTSCLSGMRSNLLSYEPIFDFPTVPENRTTNRSYETLSRRFCFLCEFI